MWLILAFISAISAGLVTIFAKIGLKSIDPIAATTIRVIVMALFFIITAFSLKKFSGFSIQGKEWLFIILSGIFGAISWLAYFMALKIGPTAKVAAIDKTSLLFVVLFSIFLLGQSLTIKNFVGIIAIIAGIFLVI